MLIIHTTDAAHATSGIQELVGQIVYSPEDMEYVVGRDDLLRLRISALPLVQTLNEALHKKMVREDLTTGNGRSLMRNIVKAYTKMGYREEMSH